LSPCDRTEGGDIDYAILYKVYGAAPESAKGKYSPAEASALKST
jgi:hypothetical protein